MLTVCSWAREKMPATLGSPKIMPPNGEKLSMPRHNRGRGAGMGAELFQSTLLENSTDQRLHQAGEDEGKSWETEGSSSTSSGEE